MKVESAFENDWVMLLLRRELLTTRVKESLGKRRVMAANVRTHVYAQLELHAQCGG